MVRPADFNHIIGKAEFVPQAVFDRPISYFADLLKVRVSEGCDDLDYYEGVGFLLNDAIPVVLKHYLGHPAGTTTMYLPFEFEDVPLISAIVQVVTTNFDIVPDAISWRRQADTERLAG